jgi:hypothetical protein
MIVTGCPKLGRITDFKGDRLELEGFVGMSQLWLPCLECLKTHGSIGVEELMVDPYIPPAKPQPDIESVSITGLKNVRLDRLTPATLQMFTEQQQSFDLLLRADSSLDADTNGWSAKHCATFFEKTPLKDLEITSKSDGLYVALIPALNKSTTLARVHFEEGERFLEVMFQSPQAAGVKGEDYSDAALTRRCKYTLPKQLAHLRLTKTGQFGTGLVIDEEEYNNRTLPLLQYLKRQYPQMKIDLAGEIQYGFDHSDGCQEIELVPAPAAPAN